MLTNQSIKFTVTQKGRKAKSTNPLLRNIQLATHF